MRTFSQMGPSVRARPIVCRAALVCLSVLFIASPAAAADISGKAEIIDGGTIVIAGQTIQLQGIIVPAFADLCGSAEVKWHCGQEAAFALADAIERSWVECDIRDAGTLQTRVGVCRVGGPKGRDLGAWMVEQGWARAAAGFASLEKAAKAAGRGLWRNATSR